MYHGATFLDVETEESKQTFEDFHLIPKTRLYIGPPEFKANLIDIPGADGYLDASEAPDGRAHFGARSTTWELEVQRQYRNQYHYLFSEIMNYLHGRSMRIILDDDPQYFYVGRAVVNEFLSEEMTGRIVIDVTTQPFKYEVNLSTYEWLWDSFNFETDFIRGYGNLQIDGELTVQVLGGRKPIIPAFSVSLTSSSSPITLTFEGTEYSLSAGDYKMTDIILKSGINAMKFSGSGTVSIVFRGCSL